MKCGFAPADPDVGKSTVPSFAGCAEEGAEQADAAINIPARPAAVSRVI